MQGATKSRLKEGDEIPFKENNLSTSSRFFLVVLSPSCLLSFLPPFLFHCAFIFPFPSYSLSMILLSNMYFRPIIALARTEAVSNP